MKSGLKFWLALLGLFPSVASVISVVQRVFNVGLVPLFADALAFYRDLISPLFGWMPFSPPYWYKDLVVISTVATVSFVRAYVSPRITYELFFSGIFTWERWKAFLQLFTWVFCATFLLGGVLLIFMIPLALTSTKDDADHNQGMKDTAVLFAMSIAAAAIFFATNAVFRA